MIQLYLPFDSYYHFMNVSIACAMRDAQMFVETHEKLTKVLELLKSKDVITISGKNFEIPIRSSSSM